MEKALTPEEERKNKDFEKKQGELMFNPFGLNSPSENSVMSDNAKKGSSESSKKGLPIELGLSKLPHFHKSDKTSKSCLTDKIL